MRGIQSSTFIDLDPLTPPLSPGKRRRNDGTSARESSTWRKTCARGTGGLCESSLSRRHNAEAGSEEPGRVVVDPCHARTHLVVEGSGDVRLLVEKVIVSRTTLRCGCGPTGWRTWLLSCAQPCQKEWQHGKLAGTNETRTLFGGGQRESCGLW
jgi:hypothetical protein